jgi:aspartyl aminopeptidase
MQKALSKKELKQLKEQLFYKPKLVWDQLSEDEKKEVFQIGERYKKFLTRAKTEREAVTEIVSAARSQGFEDIGEAGTDARKVYAVNRGKGAILAVLGTIPPQQGLRIVASHIDSPRLDLKQHPLYEELDLVFLKTHYYGGIKKYQWVARPLAIHGKVVLKNGNHIDLRLGEEEHDPIFTINDLLPHLARNVQYEKKLPEIVVGEKLNVLVGALPHPAKEAEQRFKMGVLVYLRDTYGMMESDLMTAELEVVPAGPAKDLGLDRSMVGSYGQDDRACAFSSLEAICSLQDPRWTALALFMDKEEIGSEGATSARSRFLANFLADLYQLIGQEPREAAIRKNLFLTKAISADVNGAMDPDYQEVHEKRNASLMGYGVSLCKFTGSGGKIGSSDADAEYLAWFRGVMEKAGVIWQTGELGKVDEGGGGTIAKFLAEHGMEIVDVGTPVLSIHSPFEVSHKADIYMTFKCYQAFYSAE